MDTIPRHYCIHYRIIFVLLSDRTKRSFFVIILLDTSLPRVFLFSVAENVIKRKNRRSVTYIFIDKKISSKFFIFLDIIYTNIYHVRNSLLEMQHIKNQLVLFRYLKSGEKMHREGGEVKSARYRLRLRGAEREGTSTPSRIDRTVDASPF